MQITPNFWNCTKIDMCKGVKLKLPHAMQNEIFEQMLQKYIFQYPTQLSEKPPFSPHNFSFFLSQKETEHTVW